MTDLQEKQVNYNDEPVHYCPRCLSLKIMRVQGMDDLDYCDTCGSTSTEQCHIEEWREKYKEKYGFDYLNNKF